MRRGIGHAVGRFHVAALAAVTSLCGAAAGGWASPGLTLEFDGETHVFVPQMDGARTGFTRLLSVDAVSIEGTDGPARLVVELALPPRGSQTPDVPHDARIIFRPDGWRDYWVSAPDYREGSVLIDQIDLAGLSPRIVGRFEMPLCFTPTPVHAPDTARCLPASGRFDTDLVRD
jgi:hypothetical protein